MSEALEAFIGKWREDTKDNFDEFAAAMGLSQEKTEFYKAAQTVIAYNKDGDIWVIDVGVCKDGVDVNGKQFRFQLGVPYPSANLDGTPMQSKIEAQGGQFVETHKMPEVDTEMNITRHIEGNKMVVITDYKGHVMKTLYSRVPV